MAITQTTLTLTPEVAGEKRATGTWATGLATPKLVGAVPVLPTSGNALANSTVTTRARMDGATVTVEVTGASSLSGPVDVLVSVDA